MANVSNMELDLRGLFEHNSSFDYDLDYEYTEEKHPMTPPAFWDIFIPILYSLVLVVGLLGNSLVLVVLWQKRRCLSVMDIVALHLTVVDTLLLLTMPLWAVDAVKGWTLGTPVCKIAGALFKIKFYSGVFLLACISLDRYLSVVHNVQMYSRRKPWLIQLSCTAVSLLLSIPEWLYLQAARDDRRGDKTECVYSYPPELRLGLRLLYHVLGFLLPAVVLLYCYCCILVRLQRGSQGVQKQRAVRVILALVLAFFICWTPYNIALLVDTVQLNHRSSADLSVQHRWSAVKLTAVLGFLHCSVNPLIYVGLSRKFRCWVLGTLKSCGSVQDGGVVSLWDLGEMGDRSQHATNDFKMSPGTQRTDEVL